MRARLPETATLHEKTVQAVARGEIENKRARTYRGRRTLAVTTRDERVPDIGMEAALALAEGDVSRIEIVHEHEIIIHNNKRSS